MSNAIFDLEQQIMDCWRVTDDIDLVTKHFVDDPDWEGMDPKVSDAIMNKYLAIKELYELKFQQQWSTFEAVCKQYHSRNKRHDHETGEDWPDEERMDNPVRYALRKGLSKKYPKDNNE